MGIARVNESTHNSNQLDRSVNTAHQGTVLCVKIANISPIDSGRDRKVNLAVVGETAVETLEPPAVPVSTSHGS